MHRTIVQLAGLAAVALTLSAAPGLAASAFEVWDADGDGALDQDEFETGMEQIGAFGLFDQDDDEWLDEGEFRDVGVGNGNLFDEWDLNDNHFLDENEFLTGVFGHYDAEGDGRLDAPAFGELTDDVTDNLGDEDLFDV